MTMRRAAVLLGWFSALLAGAAGAQSRLEVWPESPSPGEVFAIRADGVPGRVVPEATFAGQKVLLWQSATGWEGLAAVDRDAPPGPTELTVNRREGGSPLASIAVHVGSRAYPEQRLTVDEGMVTLSPADQERAEREALVIRAALAGRTPERLWSGSFQPPVDGPVSSPFGVRRFYNGKRRGYHSGLDIAAPRGTPVLAAAAGAVVLARDLFYTGKTVFLDHGLGLFTAYFHMESFAVAEGEQVGAGGVLGRVGSTGRSTGAHLHWGVYVAGVKADPFSLVRATGGAAGGGESP
jgi:murein DD-endopeptidase MepM/ murein hydrolase activator NlpD